MKKQRLLFIAVLLLLLIGICLGLRICKLTDHTTYIPFSGRIFSLNAETVDEIYIRSGKTGNTTTMEQKEEIISLLNNLKAMYWFPEPPFPETGGWSYCIDVWIDDVRYSYMFGYGISKNKLVVNGIVYTLPKEQSDSLKHFVD